MPTFEVGQTITWGLKTYDSAGALGDVGTGPTATVTKPDGTTTSAVVTKTATGTYSATYTASAVGRWLCRWSGSGLNAGGLPYTDLAIVGDYSRLIIPLGEARAALNLPAGQVANDDEVRNVVAAATEVIEDIVGPVAGDTVTDTFSGRWRYALPLTRMATGITEVTEDGVTLDPLVDYALDEHGMLHRGTSIGSMAWSGSGIANVVVEYTVGRTITPASVLEAARDLVRHLYGRQQSGRPMLGSLADPGMVTTPSGFAVPNAVLELCKPHRAGRVPGLA